MQDPTNPECLAVESFIWLTRHDPTADVRRAALAAMVLTTRTLPSLIERCRDVSDAVRRTAYKIMASRSVLRPLSIAKRIRVLQDGLSDRSVDVKRAAQELVLAWFKVTENDPVRLLRRLDTEGVPDTSQLMLDNLFAVLPSDEFKAMVKKWSDNNLDQNHILKVDCMNSESAFFWRALIEFLAKRQSDVPPISTTSTELDNDMEDKGDTEAELPLIDSVLPSVSPYVDLIKWLIEKLVQSVVAEEFDEKTMELECVVLQVLRIASSLDLSDEFGRRRLVSLVHNWITSPTVPDTLSPQLLKAYALLEPDLRKRVANVIEMISELCDPTEPIQSAGASSSCTEQGAKMSPLVDGVPETKNVDKVVAEISKETERNIRLKIAKIDVRMNELNESLHECVKRKDFERATSLRDECDQLDSERSALLRELHGTHPCQSSADVANVEQSPDKTKNPTKVDQQVVTGTGDDAEDEAAEDAHQGLLDRCSASVLLKANRIASLLVQQSNTLWRLPASLRSLLDSLIFPSIQHADPSVRNQAILALGLCCSMDLPLATQYLPLFYSAMRVDHVMISETALRCIVDCLLIFGFRPFHEANIRPNTRIASTDDSVVEMQEEDNNDAVDTSDFVVLLRRTEQDAQLSCANSTLSRREDMSKTAALLIKPIMELLNSDDDDLRTTSALGLAKLLLYDRLISSQILSVLLLLWFNPISEDRPAIRRGLACFFTDYACGNTASSVGSGVGNYDHQAALADAVLPTLTTLIRAPASSPLSEVEPADVASLLARLTDTTSLQPPEEHARRVAEPPSDTLNGSNTEASQPKTVQAKFAFENENPHHDRLALSLANEILKAPQSAEAKLYLRMLCQLRLSRNNVSVHKELLILANSMVKFVDRSSALVLHRFRKQIDENLERLGFNPAQLLEEAKNVDEQSSPEPSNSAELNCTLLSTSRPSNLNHPTLLGSARVNMHLLDDNHERPDDHRPHASSILAQTNRTLAGLSILDKSGRHATLLNFSDDESEEDTTQLESNLTDQSHKPENRESSADDKKVTTSAGPVKKSKPSKRRKRTARVKVPSSEESSSEMESEDDSNVEAYDTEPEKERPEVGKENVHVIPRSPPTVRKAKGSTAANVARPRRGQSVSSPSQSPTRQSGSRTRANTRTVPSSNIRRASANTPRSTSRTLRSARKASVTRASDTSSKRIYKRN
ncbi:unnamed protein product [Calicophoron daubneyi]